MAKVLKDAVAKRLAGDRPSPVQAALASIVAGVAVAVITYRVMRN
jgi:uncharacterized OsmC-like protein